MSVRVRDLRKAYGDTVAVDGPSFEISAGEVLALLGPNGAGKTTTVECIAGLRVPDAGSVRVLDLDPHAARDTLTPQLGMMLQEGGVHRGATPAELVRTFAAYYDNPLEPAHLLERLGLARLAHRRVRSLSGGEVRRLSFALAIVGRPRVVLLDEPTVGMDPQARRDAWTIVEELRADGTAVLLTTHQMDEAEHLADRVAVLDSGRLVALDRPTALRTSDAALIVETPAHFDTAALAVHVDAPVTPAGTERWHVAVGADRIADVASWFAAQRLPLRSVGTAKEGLEDAYLRLTDPGTRP